MKETYRLINYFDVWKEADGDEGWTWQVNNLCSEGEIEIDDDITHEGLLKAIIDFGFFKPSVTLDMIDIWDDGDMVEFYQASDSMPICRLERIFN